MLHVLVLFAACAGETTAPEAPTSPTTPTAPYVPVGFRVLPGTVTVETGQRIRFRGELRTLRGQVYAPALSWEASGGSIHSDGTFFATQPGTYRVVGRGHGGQGREGAHLRRPDTSVVVVVPQQPALIGIRVTPRAPRLSAGATQTFKALGRLADGTTAEIGVTWKATGGTIDPDGSYQAGNVAGRYLVMATNTSGTVADTVKVTIRPSETTDTTPAPTPDPTPDPTDPSPDPTEPTPDPTPAPTLAQVVLRPIAVTLATGAIQPFAAWGKTSAGDSVAIAVSFRATGGTITSSGLYTAGPTAGSYQVIATSGELADTTVVTLAQTSGSGGRVGLPFGAYQLLKAGVPPGPLTLSNAFNTASTIISQINAARSLGIRLMLVMTGGAHSIHNPGEYLSIINGVLQFDRAKWDAKMATFDVPAIRDAIARGVADGTILGATVMDEPYVSGRGDGNTWGPPGTMTKARVDSLCAEVKRLFPTLPAGVEHQHQLFEPTKSYRTCDFIVDQYNAYMGPIAAWRDAGLAMARRDGHAVLFSLNILNGGTQDKDGTWDCAGTGGKGLYAPNCRMTAEQVRQWGLTLGVAGCGLFMWRYDSAFMTNTANQQAFRDVAGRMATAPAAACRRT